MQPIYEDLIKMWKENGFDYEIYPGTFWLDNSITFKKHSNCPDYTDFNFETWEETAKRIKPVFNLPVLYT